MILTVVWKITWLVTWRHQISPLIPRRCQNGSLNITSTLRIAGMRIETVRIAIMSKGCHGVSNSWNLDLQVNLNENVKARHYLPFVRETIGDRLSSDIFTRVKRSTGDWGVSSASLQWRHNGHDSVSNHHRLYCLLNRFFRRRSKKTSKLRVTGLCEGNSPGTGEFPAQMASNAENVSIWWRHHVEQYWRAWSTGGAYLSIVWDVPIFINSSFFIVLPYDYG